MTLEKMEDAGPALIARPDFLETNARCPAGLGTGVQHAPHLASTPGVLFRLLDERASSGRSPARAACPTAKAEMAGAPRIQRSHFVGGPFCRNRRNAPVIM